MDLPDRDPRRSEPYALCASAGGRAVLRHPLSRVRTPATEDDGIVPDVVRLAAGPRSAGRGGAGCGVGARRRGPVDAGRLGADRRADLFLRRRRAAGRNLASDGSVLLLALVETARGPVALSGLSSADGFFELVMESH